MAPSTRNPTHGQKVDLGADAPVTTEGPGKIASDSLAAESQAFKEANDLSSEQIADQGKEDFGSASRPHHESGSARHGVHAHSGSGGSSNENHGHSHSKNNKGNHTDDHNNFGNSSNSDKQHDDSKQRSGRDNQDGFSKSKGLGDDQADPAPTYVNNVLGTNRDPHEGPHGKNIKEDESIASQDKKKNASFTEFGTKADPGRLAEKKFALKADQGEITDSSAPRQSKIADGSTPYDVLGSSNKA